MGSNLISGEETKLFLDMHAKQQRIAYLGAMQVDHFVAASRLTKTWLLQRFYDAGRSEMRILTGYPKIRIVVRHIAKLGLDMARWCKAPFTERATTRVRTTAAFLQGCWQEFVGKAKS
jgi:acyl CoA:acetate/3-ketoacid CoA transferase beta subunit